MGVPFCESPWNEIVPNLWMGGHDYMPLPGQIVDAVVGDEFDLVVSLYERWGCGPDPGVGRRYLRIPDGQLTDEDMAGVRELADLTAAAVQRGHRVLVRCQAGYNRSGLVTALTLLRLGHAAGEAVGLIRTRRSPFALCNETFVGYIHAEAVSAA